MRGSAWEALAMQALAPASQPRLSNQDDPTNVRVLAKALYHVRTGDPELARQVADACRDVQGSERGATALAVGRELIAYVLAADLVGLPPDEREAFSNWLRKIQRLSFSGRSLRGTHEDRPNNWGTHAGASRLAIAAYLGDLREIERAAHVFRGWAGEAEGWRHFDFGDRAWQADARSPFAVNPLGALRDGHAIGGVLPDDQRRAAHSTGHSRRRTTFTKHSRALLHRP